MTATHAPESPRQKPVVVFDGECKFCRRWIERWKQTTGEDRVAYVTYQESAADFPEVPAEQFRNAIKLRHADGSWAEGAAAVFHLLNYGPTKSRLFWCYRHLPGFASVAEGVYGFVARHRGLASRVSNALYGPDVRRPEYHETRRWFFRGLGLVYLAAFLSLWVQIDGLIGAHGILPVRDFLGAVEKQYGPERFYLLPTLCWLDRSDLFLHLLCGAGMVLACFLAAGLLPPLVLILLWTIYLSLTIAGQTFLSFQWDVLLLEVGFVSLFFAPWQLWPQRDQEPPVSRVGLFLLRWLLFRFMFASGLVKLTSGDDSWWDLTALKYHYETQPLPTVFGWVAHQLPPWFGSASVFLMFTIEMVAPFFIFGPRRVRLLAFIALAGLQLLIVLTGNYGFFNLLTLVLCLTALDDSSWQRLRRRPPPRRIAGLRLPHTVNIPVAAVLVAVGLMLLRNDFSPGAAWPKPVEKFYGWIAPVRSINPYGLFRVMTRRRPEIIVEGSDDGTTWAAYEFKWKAGDLSRGPALVAPHMPRLDWQMWFAALGSPQHNPWFLSFLGKLLEGSPPVTALLHYNPFPDAPPRFIRATVYDYHMTDLQTLRREGGWWWRDHERVYVPPASLRTEKAPGAHRVVDASEHRGPR